MAKRISIFVFGVLSYAVFFATFLYACGFIANVLVPKSIDSGTPGAPGVAVAVDLGLLLLFALQHSVMARPGFKAWWTRLVPHQAERSVYVLASSLAMIALFAFWQPLPEPMLTLSHPTARAVAYGLCAVGTGLVLYSTFLIDHFDLFGLRQVWLALRGKVYTHRPFRTPSLYRWVRHPLYVGWMLFFWATPDFTQGHVLMAAATTAYMLVAIVYEERDLLAHFGDDYRAWRARTPMFVPRLRRGKKVRSHGAPQAA